MSYYHYLDPTEPFERSLGKHIPYLSHVSAGKGNIRPKVDVQETDKETLIHAEIPGVKKEDVKLTTDHDGSSIVISGSCKREENIKDVSMHIHERMFGHFERIIKLPMGSEANKAKAKFEHGLLTVTVPKGDTKSCVQIEIE